MGSPIVQDLLNGPAWFSEDAEADAIVDPRGLPRTAPLPSLQSGSAGIDVVRLQRLLNISGAQLVEHGRFDADTDAALRAYQAGRAPTSPRGVSDEITWGLLMADASPSSASPLGEFAAMVPRFVDPRIARLLASLWRVRLRLPANPAPRDFVRWAADAPTVAAQWLRGGHLIGLHSVRNFERIARVLQPSARAGLPSQLAVGAVREAAHWPVSDRAGPESMSRGFILFNERFLELSPWEVNRRFARKLTLVKLLNIFVNRVRDFSYPGLPALDRVPLTAEHFVDPALAASSTGLAQRKQFVYQVTAAHVAWYASRELRGLPTPLWPTVVQSQIGPEMPTRQQFFRAAVNFATAMFGNAGYLGRLRPQPARFRLQLALWLSELQNMDFHSLTFANRRVQEYFRVLASVMRNPIQWDPQAVPRGLA